MDFGGVGADDGRKRRATISHYRPSTAHADLGSAFFDPVKAAAFPKTVLRYRNQYAAEAVGLGGLSATEWVVHFGAFEPLEGSLPEPLALRYHGHQFRSYNPDLGDGRGFLFAQLRDDKDRLLDLGTKGSGQTPWSRRGDGRLTLKGGVREVLATSMLQALGVDTSKSFSLIETGEQLVRGDEPSPTRSAVLVRLSHSHIRIGSFQRLAYLQDEAGLEQLLDHAIKYYYPELGGLPLKDRVSGFLKAVATAVARTGARWIAAGFVHGVLNTDNINITGESFDYGPWRFLPHYDADFTAAYFDQTGLYAFGRQPETLAWNLTRLAECLLPLGEQAELEVALNSYWPVFRTELAAAYLARLGLRSAGAEADAAFVEAWIGFLARSKVGYEQAFFDWFGGVVSAERAAASPAAALYADAELFGAVRGTMAQFKPKAGLQLDGAYFAKKTPRTMLIEDVERIWAGIVERDDWAEFEAVLLEIAEMGAAYQL